MARLDGLCRSCVYSLSPIVQLLRISVPPGMCMSLSDRRQPGREESSGWPSTFYLIWMSVLLCLRVRERLQELQYFFRFILQLLHSSPLYSEHS